MVYQVVKKKQKHWKTNEKMNCWETGKKKQGFKCFIPLMLYYKNINANPCLLLWLVNFFCGPFHNITSSDE